MTASLSFRWLGVAGLEFTLGEHVLAIDPFFTRPSWWKLFLGRVHSDLALSLTKIPVCQDILVTHSHYDHLMDVPGLASQTNAQVYGSMNTCRLCLACDLLPEQAHEIAVNDRLSLGPFRIRVLPAKHTGLPLDHLVNGPLASSLRAPLRLRDYRMDTCFSFLIDTQELTLLIGDQPEPADVLFFNPLRPRTDLRAIMPVVKPSLIIPIHWDNFFSPFTKPVRPIIRPTWQSLLRLDRVNLTQFKQDVERLSPGTRVLIPEIFQTYHPGQMVTTEESSSRKAS
jgi:L-ascorbate metabolism protein UlaG (beta-lactamase superfamily)